MQATMITVSTTNAITTITLNRPDKRNAMNGLLIQELKQTLEHLTNDPVTRLLIIRGAGEHFCAGADIAWMREMAMGVEDKNSQDAYLIADLMFALYSFPKPTIALVHGATMGGGLGLLAACDIGVASENAVFGFSEVKIGIAPSTISPYVIAAMGARAAHYYFLTGERFKVDEAYRLGLVHRIAEDSTLVNVGMNLAKMMLQNGPHAMASAKQLIRYVSNKEINIDLAQKTAEHLANLRASPEAEEGLQAFIEKRLPVWSSSSR